MPLRMGIKRKLAQRSGRVKSSGTEPRILGSSYLGTMCIWNHQTQISGQHKKRRISWHTGIPFCETFSDGSSLPYLPTLEAVDYYMQPSLKELAAREHMDPGYSSRVLDFTVGRFGYGSVKYPGETDVRCLELDKIVKFRRHEVIVYEDESAKPLVGQGLNKPAEVTLTLQTRPSYVDERQKDSIVKKLRHSVEGQGAHFISFNRENWEWKFFVNHFSRFGLSEEDEEDMIMEDTVVAQDPPELNHDEISDADEENQMDPTGIVRSHSLPAHLGLDPMKMQEMRMLMFSDVEEEAEDLQELPTHYNPSFGREYTRSPLQNAQRTGYRSTPPAMRKTPLALLEYKHGSFDSNSPGAILMTQENKAMPLKSLKEGFKLDLSSETPVTRKDSRNIVDCKSEIENWDLGAGIYISFYLTRSSLQGADDAMSELDSVESKNAASREFLGQLNQSLAVWGARLPMDVRVVYSKMADEICNLLLSDIGEGPTRDVQLSCFDTIFCAPIPEDLRSNHLQDAVSLFTCFLTEVAT